MPLDFHNPLIFELLGERVLASDDHSLFGKFRNCLTYFLYLVAAIIFFALDVSLAVLLIVFGHLVVLGFGIISAFAGLVELIWVWIARRRSQPKNRTGNPP